MGCAQLTWQLLCLLVSFPEHFFYIWCICCEEGGLGVELCTSIFASQSGEKDAEAMMFGFVDDDGNGMPEQWTHEAACNDDW